jgi:hypothetical protein
VNEHEIKQAFILGLNETIRDRFFHFGHSLPIFSADAFAEMEINFGVSSDVEFSPKLVQLSFRRRKSIRNSSFHHSYTVLLANNFYQSLATNSKFFLFVQARDARIVFTTGEALRDGSC